MINKLLTLKQIIINLIFLPKDHKDDLNYKPNLLNILSDTSAAYVVELWTGGNRGKWFRILRIKNNRRTHDFIIDNFEDNTIIIENDKSQYVRVQFESVEFLISMFRNVKLFRNYSRPKVRSHYSPVLKSKITVDDLFAEAGLDNIKTKKKIIKEENNFISLKTVNEIFKKYKEEAQTRRSIRAVGYHDETSSTLEKLHQAIKRKANK